MNQTIRQLCKRKSVRAFTDEAITEQEKELIFSAALEAPTAGNMTLYTILDITDQTLKDKLSETCDHQPFIAKAPLVLVFCADYKRWYDAFCKIETTVRQPKEGDLLLAMSDTLIAAQNTVVAAESLGIGSCYIGDIIENYEIHKELLKLPKYVVPVCMLVFGRPTPQQQARPKPPRFAIGDIVHQNGYDSSKAAKMETMLALRQQKEPEELAAWLKAFCKRKWNSEFSIEMSRSAAEIIKDWVK